METSINTWNVLVVVFASVTPVNAHALMAMKEKRANDQVVPMTALVTALASTLKI